MPLRGGEKVPDKFTITDTVSIADWGSVDKSHIWGLLKQGIEEVCSDLGVETWDLPHLNSRDVFDKNRHYEEMYEGREDLIEAVRNWYGYEIVAFDYEFGTYL